MQDRLNKLQALCAAHPGVSSLIVFGSTSTQFADRRDQWSDIDFNLFVTPDAVGEIALDLWDFLPDAEHLVLTAREGGNGGVVLYDDGLICEFGAGSPWVIQDPDHEVLLDGGDIAFTDPPSPRGPVDQVGVFLVKVLIGYGRVRRGEVVGGNAHLRTYAVTALAEALRQRLAPDAPRNPFDPLRRLELALPEPAARLAELQQQDPDSCASGLLDLAEELLAPGWDEFPDRAFAVARQILARTS